MKYINAPGGGGAAMTKPDAKSLAAKYGSKTRAMFGGVPSAPKPPAAPKLPAAPKAPPAPPAPTGATSTMEEVWAKFCEYNNGKTELELYPLWAAAVEKHCGKPQNDATPADWGRMLTAFTDNLPY